MGRLTAWDGIGNTPYFPKCFDEPCLGNGCTMDDCPFMEEVCRKLAEYEDLEERRMMDE